MAHHVNKYDPGHTCLDQQTIKKGNNNNCKAFCITRKCKKHTSENILSLIKLFQTFRNFILHEKIVSSNKNPLLLNKKTVT